MVVLLLLAIAQTQHIELYMIILDEIYKNYPSTHGNVQALSNINLQIKPAEIYGIIGKSGAGKSTLIRCVNLLERPSSGKVIINGKNLMSLSAAELRAARRDIGMIFQHFNLLSSRSVYDNIALPLELAGFSDKAIAASVNPLLELTGLTEKRRHYPAQLSGGQKQRVAIARALACKPTVLLSDEATSALDPETTTTILDLLKNIRDTLQVTILLITHEMSVIKHCCDRVGILHQGQLIEENDVDEFFAHPKTDIAKNFILSSLPQRLPNTISQHLLAHAEANTHPVLRLWFIEGTATQPIISELINQYGLRINILQAHVEHLKKYLMGVMVLAIDGKKDNIQAGIDYLQSIGVNTEVIGHVPSDVIPFT